MGTRIVRDNTAEALRHFEQLADQVVRKAAMDVKANAETSINNGSKTGRIYETSGGVRTVTFYAGQGVPFKRRFMEKTVGFKVGGGDKRHQASAPGEAPATDLGTLVNSGSIVQVKPGHYQVIYSANYARSLELGTHKIAPRPFLRSALEKVKPSFLAAMRAVMKGES